MDIYLDLDDMQGLKWPLGIAYAGVSGPDYAAKHT